MKSSKDRSSLLTQIAGAAALFAGVSLAGGCYETTTRVDGAGAMGRSVEGSQRSNTAVDRWWDSTFGNPSDSGKRPTDFPTQSNR